MLKTWCLISLVTIPSLLKAQIWPKDGSMLNYRLIGFSVPPDQKATGYQLEIATGYHNSAESFNKSLVNTTSAKTNKIIAEVPCFGSAYTWRITTSEKKATASVSVFHHFNTGLSPNVDTNRLRLKIEKPAEQYKNAFIFLDGNKALYDMSGHPVWYLPDIDGYKNDRSSVRDLKLTSQGTITFLLNDRAYEINYDGDILWQAPNNGMINKEGDVNAYHHEFTRLANGHYMTLGNELVSWEQMPSTTSDSMLIKIVNADADSTNPPAHKKFFKAIFGTIVEYDKKGNIIWSWRSSEHFLKPFANNKSKSHGANNFDTHENSFFFDEKNGAVYVSFKNANRILKVKYPDGTVVADYGPGAQIVNSMFCGQHGCGMSHEGYIYLYNNNTCNESKALPKVVMFREPKSGTDTLTKIWEYECTMEGNYPKRFTTGGNAVELPGSEIFVCMGSQYSKLFIVGREKNILWSALPEKKDATDNQWQIVTQYRASIINNHKDMERLVWKIEKDQ